MKDIDQYAEWVDSVWSAGPDKKPKAVYELTDRDFAIMHAGLPEEVGEVMGLIKRSFRDHKLDKEALKKELGDAYYYLTRITTAYGIKPSEVLQANHDKIEDRINRGVLHGSGDNR
jgi:NTP pyrophosphatase (non-canonical NTP hydrolase)